jgi:phosphoglucosamine mutase
MYILIAIWRLIMKLFGTDGVRGEAGTFLTAQMAMNVAMAAGIYFLDHSKTKKILVGKDTRRSGYMIENAIVSGLTAVGYNVVQIGPMPTPAIAFLTESMRCDAGIMISASHNDYQDNGIKFFDAHGNKLSKKVENAIEAIYNDPTMISTHQAVGSKIGSSKRIDDVIGRYIVQLKNSFPKSLSLQGKRIVLDVANGAGYKVGPTVLDELGAEVIVLHNKPDGHNINELCGAMHPKDVSEAVKQYRADVGFALDGDADRLVVIDEFGEVINGDHLIGALADYFHRKGKLVGEGIVTTVMSNKGLEEFLKTQGLDLLRSDVGDKHVLSVMQQNNMNIGGEESGHVILSDYAKTGDGLATALQVLALLNSNHMSASKALRPFELYPQMKVNLNVIHKPALESIEGLNELLEAIEAKGLRHLIRYSGTENKLRLLLEGKDAALLANTMSELKEFFNKALNA